MYKDGFRAVFFCAYFSLVCGWSILLYYIYKVIVTVVICAFSCSGAFSLHVRGV